MTHDELLTLIDQAAHECWTELDLRDQEISELPPEIGQLTGLQKLSIGHKGWVSVKIRNPLTTLPPEIGQLTGLQYLDLSWNQLTAVPPAIGQLTCLTLLNLSSNQLTAMPPEIGQLTRLTELYLSGNQLTAVPPEIVQLTSLTSLYLGGNWLTAVPPEIVQLTSLTSLYLGGNWLTAVPPEIGQLTGLTALDLRGNQLTSVPLEIGRLTGLTGLHLSENPLTAVPPEIGRLTGLTELVLGDNLLTTVPPEIAQLTSLTALDLRGNQLTSVPPEIGQLTSLTVLDLSGNQLTAVPPEIGRLTSLTSLDLRDNQLTAMPPEIGRLTGLTGLHLSFNQLTAVPPEIGRLTGLTELDLSDNRLTTVPPEIGQLTSLTALHLWNNQLTAVPPAIGQLTGLTALHLWNNQLTAVPPAIGQLTGLTSLPLSGNQLTALPPEIGQLTGLASLDLGGNQLTALPPEIGQLTALTSLTLGHNWLTVLPPEIGQLTGLTSLDLGGNHFTAVPPAIVHLTSLTSLDLNGNQLTLLPPPLRCLTKLRELHLYDNHLPLPPELLGEKRKPGTPQAILDAYFQASQPLREAKLLLVGEGDVGKTAIIARLLYNRFSDTRSKTVGVDIHRWEMESEQLAGTDASGSDQRPLQINIWDFGGQEIYHATHQFFLTHRSLYLLVLDATQDEAANRLNYWLRHIQNFAGEAPILLVVNKTDLHRLALDERGLMLTYPAIRAVLHVSCKSGDGLFTLRQAIEEALAVLPHINDWIPVAWFAVKEKLAALGKDFLPYESYEDLCEAEGITYEAAQRTLAQFLHDLGAALHFHDDRRLAGTHVLNPEWVTGGIYAILNEPALQERGILRLDELDAILDRRRYPAHKHPFLLDIMGKFELAAPLADGQHYLIPGLLPKERPTFGWPTDAPVALEYRYAILPAAILSRLMVRLHHHIWQPEHGQPVRWRNGLGVARDGCRALIVADPEAARLTIALDGPAPHRRHLLAAIRAQLDEIHASFAKLEAKEWVPLSDRPGAAIPYRALLNLEARRIFTHYDPTHDVEIDVRALLDGIESAEERDIRPLVRTLQERFSKAELRQLAFEVLVDHEDLPGETKTDLARELALRCRRHGRLAELERMVGKERPLLAGRGG
jgi:internalin A